MHRSLRPSRKDVDGRTKPGHDGERCTSVGVSGTRYNAWRAWMARQWTQTEAFAHFGANLRNKRWSWSARTPDGKTVVLALWSDRFRRETSPLQYDDHRTAPDQTWTDRPGNRERLDNLYWARDHCNSIFRVVMVRPRDHHSDPREVDEAWPKDNMIMRRVALNERTGEFRAEMAEEK
jgi:hypothetical protein